MNGFNLLGIYDSVKWFTYVLGMILIPVRNSKGCHRSAKELLCMDGNIVSMGRLLGVKIKSIFGYFAGTLKIPVEPFSI